MITRGIIQFVLGKSDDGASMNLRHIFVSCDSLRNVQTTPVPSAPTPTPSPTPCISLPPKTFSWKYGYGSCHDVCRQHSLIDGVKYTCKADYVFQRRRYEMEHGKTGPAVFPSLLDISIGGHPTPIDGVGYSPCLPGTFEANIAPVVAGELNSGPGL